MIQKLLTSNEVVRLATIGVGIGATIFGLVPMIAPRFFCRSFGVPIPGDPASDVLVRSVSSRDMINGIGIISAAIHGGRVGPWLIARAVADGTDAATIVIAYASGVKGWRLGLLGVMAAGATVVDLLLYQANKSFSISGPTNPVGNP